MKGVGSNLSSGGPLRSTKRSDERLASRNLLRVLLSVSLTAEKPLSHSDEVGRYVLLAVQSFSSVLPGASSCNFQLRNSSTASLTGSPSVLARARTSFSPYRISVLRSCGQKRLSRGFSIWRRSDSGIRFVRLSITD